MPAKIATTVDVVVRRSALLDRYCTEIGRDPASLTRSIHLPVSYERPGTTRVAITDALAAGFHRIVLGLPAPYPTAVARWLTDEIINDSAQPQPQPYPHLTPDLPCPWVSRQRLRGRGRGRRSRVGRGMDGIE